MPNIIYSKSSGNLDAMFGKLETPLKVFIEKEASKFEKASSFLKKVFIVEKSDTFAETIMAQSEFDIFQGMKEGQGPENDSIQQTYKKVIEHLEFGKEFTITRTMAEDAKIGVAAEMRRRPSQFIESYYNTREKIAAQALINGLNKSMTFAKNEVDLSTYDGLPLFHKDHIFTTDKMKKKATQSNRYWGALESVTAIEEALGMGAVAMRNFLNENGEPMEYLADTILIPSNRAKLEMNMKKVVGSERTTGNDHNDINTQYGNWTLVVVPGWRSDSDKIMLMSSVANRRLSGNMFYNRVPLTITNWQDNHTGNYIWNGRCRFGVGFGTYKHIMLIEGSSTAVDGATKLA